MNHLGKDKLKKEQPNALDKEISCGLPVWVDLIISFSPVLKDRLHRQWAGNAECVWDRTLYNTKPYQ